MSSSWFVNPFAEEIWNTKYAGEFTDVEKYYRHLSQLVAQGDPIAETKFFDLLWNKRFSPAGRILAFAGRPDSKMSLMNCTTYSIEEDSLEAISKAAYAIMRASSRGQGIGIDLSKLRPRGAPVNNAARTSTGAISFMEMLNSIGSTIGQEGRRAALLFSLRVDHPDIWRPDEKDAELDGEPVEYDFLSVKRIPGRVENANISIIITDEFMEAVDKNLQWQPYFTSRHSGGAFTHLSNRYPARDLFHAIAESAWASAEPGLLMWDMSTRMSNSDLFGYPVSGVNACTEQVLDQEGVCNLGSMNLAAFVKESSTKSVFDFDAFTRDIETAIWFLDKVLDLELSKGSPISGRQIEAIKQLRRIGLGVMGLADALAKLGIVYGSQESFNFVDKLFRVFRNAAYNTSILLAVLNGPAPVWEYKSQKQREDITNSAFFNTLPEDLKSQIVQWGTRNITTMSIAPTGSISNLLGVSSGIEPIFSHAYTRRTRINGGDELIEYTNPGVIETRANGLPDSLWPTAYEISPLVHVNMQAIAQKYVDQSISKTVNLSEAATVDDIKRIYMEAWRRGLKGITVYRDGSRWEQVLYVKLEEQESPCPVCGGKIIHHDGCHECSECGWSMCEA
jgi:ribonucleoside-diphosphate reductase alpha chain